MAGAAWELSALDQLRPVFRQIIRAVTVTPDGNVDCRSVRNGDFVYGSSMALR
jgi:hypothetical protein